MVEQHKKQQDAEAASAMERQRHVAEQQAQEAIQEKENFLKQQHAHEAELLTVLSTLREQIAAMGTQSWNHVQ